MMYPFRNSRALVVVVHVDEPGSAERGLDMALEAGADGAMLIGPGLLNQVDNLDMHLLPFGCNYLTWPPPRGMWPIWDYGLHLCNLAEYWGGVGFKYQPEVELELQCKTAKTFTKVAVTSGPVTGQPPSPSKVWYMRQLLGDHPLAIASGIDVHNVKQYIAHANVFMVRTSIEGNLDNARRLADAIHSSAYNNRRAT